MKTATHYSRTKFGKFPEEGQLVEWLQNNGEIVEGSYSGGLWFLEDGIYVYYTPDFWRPRTQ